MDAFRLPCKDSWFFDIEFPEDHDDHDASKIHVIGRHKADLISKPNASHTKKPDSRARWPAC